MARSQRNRQLQPLHLFICEDSKSSKYYMQGLGKVKGINIKTENAYGTSPQNVFETALDKKKLFSDSEFVNIYCLFDKDDCSDVEFKRVIQECRKEGFIEAVSVPCYEYWLLLHIQKTSKSFLNAKECCEYFRNLYNKKFKTAYELPQLKAKSDIFNDLKEGLDFAIKNAEELDLDENSNPYTNMYKVISELLKNGTM